jgi:hypothetical protein
MANKSDTDPKQLASLLEKASTLPQDKLARANEYIENLRKEDQVDEEQKEWIHASLDYGHETFWEAIKAAEDADMAMSPILSTFLRDAAFCMAWGNKYHQDENSL